MIWPGSSGPSCAGFAPGGSPRHEPACPLPLHDRGPCDRGFGLRPAASRGGPMNLRGIERERAPEGSVDEISGNRWRRRLTLKRAGSALLKLAVLALLVAAGAWALRANLRPDRPAMDLNMRVTSGNTPFPVSIAPVERSSIAGSVVYTGSVAPFNEEDVYPRVTGRIIDMPVYPGDAVRQGQVVARLDSVELSSRVGEAEAGLAAAQASRAQMEADLSAARYAIAQMEKELAMVDAELTYSRSLIARTERLFNTGAVSRQEYERDRKSTRLNSSHGSISYAVFCLKKKKDLLGASLAPTPQHRPDLLREL